MKVLWKTVNYMSLVQIHTTCISGYKSNPHLDKLRLKIFNDHLLYCEFKFEYKECKKKKIFQEMNRNMIMYKIDVLFYFKIHQNISLA